MGGQVEARALFVVSGGAGSRVTCSWEELSGNVMGGRMIRPRRHVVRKLGYGIPVVMLAVDGGVVAGRGLVQT